jgi:hypothetical protein
MGTVPGYLAGSMPWPVVHAMQLRAFSTGVLAVKLNQEDAESAFFFCLDLHSLLTRHTVRPYRLFVVLLPFFVQCL